MATAAREVMNKRIHRSRPKIVTEYGGRVLDGEEATVVRIEASRRMAERNESSRIELRLARTDKLPIERRSVARAMLMVEIKFTKALWVLERAVHADGARGHSSRNGLAYMHDRLDQYANAVANGGWIAPAPRPSLPSSKEIDEAVKVQRWLEYLDASDARLLTIGAMSKRGDAGRKINWFRVRASLPEIHDAPVRTLQASYNRALRHMVAELAIRGIG